MFLGAVLLAAVALAVGCAVAFRLGQRAGITHSRQELRAVQTVQAVMAASAVRRDLRETLAAILERAARGLEATSGSLSLSEIGGDLRLVHAVGVEDVASMKVVGPDDALVRQLATAGELPIVRTVDPVSPWAALAGNQPQCTLVVASFGAGPRRYGVLALAWPNRRQGEAAAATVRQVATVAGQVLADFEPIEQKDREFHLALDGLRHLQTMTATLAHDIGNGLTTLTLLLDLQVDTGTPEERRVAGEMLAYLEVARSLRGDLMNLGRQKRIEPERVSPRTIADLVRGMVTRYLGHAGLMFTICAPDDLPDMWVERVGLLRVLDNLIQNAARYNHPSGQVWLTARPAGDWIEWEVGDTGIGIPDDALTHLFDYGFRVPGHEPRSKGMGIGLWSSRQIVEAHGGRIWVTSTPGGTRFFFTVPAVPEGERQVIGAPCDAAHGA